MKTLHEIKDEVAEEAGFHNWDNLCFVWAGFIKQIEPYMDEAARRYAEEALKEAAKRAKVHKTGNSGSYLDASVNRQSILNLINELK